MKRTATQNRWLWGVLNKMHYSKDDIETQVLSMTKGRTSSTKEMTMEECRNYIGWLGTQPCAGTDNACNISTKVPTPGDKMRKQIFSIMYELHVIHKDMNSYEKVCAINNYLMGCKSTFKKPLKELTEEELHKTVTQLELIKNNQLKKR